MRSVLITRPQEEAKHLAAMLSSKGIKPITEPLLRVEPLHGNKGALEAALHPAPAALLVTSKRALAALSEMSVLRDISVFCVGAATMRYATELGYECKDSCETAQALIERVSKHFSQKRPPRLLYLRGEDISTDIAAELEGEGFSVESVILYRAIAAERFSPFLQSEMARGNVAGGLFFSRRTADVYVSLVKAHGLEAIQKTMAAVCMSEAVAKSLRSLAWKSVSIAETPDIQHMLEAAIQAF